MWFYWFFSSLEFIFLHFMNNWFILIRHQILWIFKFYPTGYWMFVYSPNSNGTLFRDTLNFLETVCFFWSLFLSFFIGPKQLSVCFSFLPWLSQYPSEYSTWCPVIYCFPLQVIETRNLHFLWASGIVSSAFFRLLFRALYSFFHTQMLISP